jgi:glycosyltransferase involved in cell wall biosynthesis
VFSLFLKLVQNNHFNRSSDERKVLWWKPWLNDTALHKMADMEIAKQLSLRNYQISLIVPMNNGKMIFSNNDPKINIIPLKIKFLPFVSQFIRFILLSFFLPICVLVLKPNFLVAEPDISILSLIPVYFFCKLKRIKIILDIRSVPVETFGFQGFMINLWFTVSVSLAKRFFDGITVITCLMKGEICDRFRIAKKIGVWTSGVSIDLFDPTKDKTQGLKLKNKLGLSSRFVVFYHGGFSATRGLRQCVMAMATLKKDYPDIVLFLLGSGPITSDLRKLIRKEELEFNVIIHDPVDQKEIPAFISMCDVAIVPLPNNSFWRFQSPLKLLEYLAMEKAVIVTDIPAHRSVIGENNCGYYLSSINPSDIAEVIDCAYVNKESLKYLGKNGRKIVEEKYTWKNVAKDLDNYLSSIK